MRILGKGKTALAIQQLYNEVTLYDDNDKQDYDIQSNQLTVVSPGIPPFNYLVKNTINLISDYDLFLTNKYYIQKDNLFTIWISGTNGKTTTTQMLEHLLKDKGYISGGNIGEPLANVIHKSDKLILETSSFTLHYTKYAKPNIYILLPISEDHISWHGSFEQYENAKLKPLDKLSKDDIAIIPDKYSNYPTNGLKICYKTSEDLADYFNIDIQKINFEEPFLLDAILSVAVQKIVFDKIDYDKINCFIQDKHKLEEFKDNKGRIWVDDSKATNVDATIQALKKYKNKKIYLILGGDDKGANMNPLFEELVKYNLFCLFIGSNETKLFELSKKFNINGKCVKDLYLAVDEINKIYNDINSIALLSPAAASLDQFSSYKQRGEKFKNFVKKI